MSRRRTCRTNFIPSVLAAALCAFAVLFNTPVSAVGQKSIKRDDARKLIAALSIFELNKEAVTIREISAPGPSATVLASVKLGFRFVRDEAGLWRVADVRTGDRRWESLELLGRALGGENLSPARAELDALAAELDALVRNKAKTANDAPTGQAAPGQAANAESQNQTESPNQAAKEVKRGVLTVKDPAAGFAPLGSSVVVEVEVETSVDFARDERGRWQVTGVRPGASGQGFEAFEPFERALNAEKLARARAELESLAAALEAYRRARGFYVVAESAVALVDHLNPRYTSTFIRFDPWHHPYEYEGTRERFTLRSLGADGKANTADDVTIAK